MSDNFLLGLQDFRSGSNDLNLLEYVVERILNRRSHATLVKVVRAPYNSSGSTITPGSDVAVGYVDVQPLVNQVDGKGAPVPHQTVFHLSYFRYQGGNNAFICDPVVGDIGKMVVADRDTSLVKATGSQANPGSLRRNNYSDGTYFGVPQGPAPHQYFAWLSSGFDIVDSYGNTIQGRANGVYINGALITLAGDVLNVAGTSLTTHYHTQGPDSHGDTEENTSVPVVGS